LNDVMHLAADDFHKVGRLVPVSCRTVQGYEAVPLPR
jgi:hypothetical protein